MDKYIHKTMWRFIYGQGQEREAEKVPFVQKTKIDCRLINLVFKCSIVCTSSYAMCLLVVLWTEDWSLPSFYQFVVSQFDIPSDNQDQINGWGDFFHSFKILRTLKEIPYLFIGMIIYYLLSN